MNVDQFLSTIRTPGRVAGMGLDRTSERERNDRETSTSRKRAKLSTPADEINNIRSGTTGGIMKKPASQTVTNTSLKSISSMSNVSLVDITESSTLDISDEERLRILQMVEAEPEGALLDESALKRMVSVLEKRIARNQEMRIKFPEQPEKFMESEIELHESVQELHALATMSELYPLAVELTLPTTLLGLLSHENADISCAILNLLQEVTDIDIIHENEEATSALIDNILDQQGISLLTQNLDRLDEANRDESDGAHNTLSIFENLFEIRPHLCGSAGSTGLLQWLLKRLKARIPFDGNKLYVAEILAILLQETPENRATLGDLDGIDILLQQLASYKRHDPITNEEAEFMENIFNCLCSALLWGNNREKFLKGEGPQLMNLMLREKKQSRSGSLKVLNHAITGPEGTANANKFVEILGLRTLFPLFMKTPKKSKRKGLTSLELEEHVLSILGGLLQHVTGQNRIRILTKFEENDFEKVERLGELHFKYLERVNTIDKAIVDEMNEMGDKLDEEDIYLRRLESGLFSLQLIDYIILEIIVYSQKVKERLNKIIQLRKGTLSTVKEIVKEFATNLGEENKDWKAQQGQNIDTLLDQCGI